MSCAPQPQEIYLGESTTLVLVVEDPDGERLDLSVYVGLELQVKAADGAADPPLLSKSIGSGITIRTQTGDDVGIADVAIATADTTTSPWPVAPDNVGIFRFDVVGIDVSDDRDILIPPSNWVVKQTVNTP